MFGITLDVIPLVPFEGNAHYVYASLHVEYIPFSTTSSPAFPHEANTATVGGDAFATDYPNAAAADLFFTFLYSSQGHGGG